MTTQEDEGPPPPAEAKAARWWLVPALTCIAMLAVLVDLAVGWERTSLMDRKRLLVAVVGVVVSLVASILFRLRG